MPDLKAAAERLRDKAKHRIGEIRFFVGMEQSEKRIAAEADDYLLAAQALEAWAWQQERKATVQPYNGGWLCGTIDNSGHADTPLGSVLAAMEGEKNG